MNLSRTKQTILILLFSLLSLSTVSAHTITITAVKIGNYDTKLKTCVRNFGSEDIATTIVSNANSRIYKFRFRYFVYDSLNNSNQYHLNDSLSGLHHANISPNDPANNLSSRKLDLIPRLPLHPYYLVVQIIAYYEDGYVATDLVAIRIKPIVPKPLPVVLTAFSARSLNATNVQVDWTTQTEIDTDRYEVEKSEDGKTWLQVARVQAKGVSDYRVKDAYRDGYIYYRLHSIDLDGTSSYSPVSTIVPPAADYIVETRYVDLAGRYISKPAQGFYIEMRRYSSGRLVKEQVYQQQ